MSHLLLLATELQEDRGGIAAVNLVLMRNLLSLTDAGETLRVISLHDTQAQVAGLSIPGGDAGKNIRIKACHGNRLLFLLMTLAWAMGASRIIAGHVRLAVPLLIFPRVMQRLVVFGHGSEVTHRISDSSRWVLDRAQLILANSTRTANRMRIVSADIQPVACPLGLADDSDHSLVGELPGLTNVAGNRVKLGERVLLLVGRMDPDERQKGHRELLQVLPEVLRIYPDVQLVFAGPGADQAVLAELAKQSGLAEHVFIDGPLPRPALNALFKHCFAFVMPSQQEGFGIVYLEAMRFSRACLGCRDDGAEEIIVDGETGLLLARQDDLPALTAAIKALLENPDRTAEMGRKGHARWQEMFTSQQFDQRLQQALRELP